MGQSCHEPSVCKKRSQEGGDNPRAPRNVIMGAPPPHGPAGLRSRDKTGPPPSSAHRTVLAAAPGCQPLREPEIELSVEFMKERINWRWFPQTSLVYIWLR